MGHLAQRTCIGCRTVDEPDHLMRLTVQTGATGAVVVLDEDRTLGGRGAWLHRTETCVDNAVRRRAFNRAFRAQVDFESVVQQIKQASDLEAEHE